MGAWVTVEYRPDDIVVLRRNPYYWKVDADGNQLPYLDEMHYRLSTWADRDVQAVAGTGDFSNLEQAENYVEALRRSAEDVRARAAPVRAAHHRLLDGPQPLGQRLGRARRARPGGADAEPERGLPDRRQPGHRPAAAGREPRQGAVHRPVPGRPLCRDLVLRRRLDGLLSLQPRVGGGALRGGGPRGHGRRRLRQLPGGRGGRRATCRSPCSSTATTRPTRTSPRAWSP